MSRPQLTAGLDILDRIRNILLENESLKNINAELAAHNIELSSRVTKLNIRLRTVQANPSEVVQQDLSISSDTSVLDAPLSQTTSTASISMSSRSDSPLEYTPFFSGTEARPTTLLNLAKPALKTYLHKSSTALIVLPRIGFTWKELPNNGSLYKPTQVFLKAGNSVPVGNKKFHKTREVVAYIEGRWCYMGSFKVSKQSPLSPSEYLSLPSATRQMLINQTAGKAIRRVHDIPAMYASGELVAVQIDLERIGFNKDVCQCLLDAAEELHESGEVEYHQRRPRRGPRRASDEFEEDD